MYNVSVLKFRKIGSQDKDAGYLTPLNFMEEIPFPVKRIYYIYGVNSDKPRGEHSHKRVQQVLICLNGTVKVTLENYFGKEEYVLDDPSKGLWVGLDNWGKNEFSKDAVLLVLASGDYDEDDYIRDYDNFITYTNAKYGNIKKEGNK